MSQTKAQLIDNLVQPITGAAGSESAPTFSFTADPNTGIYSPGADQLAISTNGTGRLFVDSSGRFLVGTSSAYATTGGTETPIVQFQSTNSIPPLTISQAADSAAPAVFQLVKSRSTTNSTVLNGDNIGLVQFQAADGTNLIRAAEIRCVSDGTPGTNSMPGRLQFSTTPSGGASAIERLRITSDGKVGVGTTSPARSFHAFSDSSPNAALIESSHANNASFLRFKDLSTSSTVNEPHIGSKGDNFTINTGNTERARIDDSGKLLVGTSSALDFASTTTAGNQIGSTGIQASRSSAAGLNLQRTTSDGSVAGFWRENTLVGTISVDATSTAYNQNSDYRLKENVTPVTDGITRLQQLKPSRFNFIADPDKTVDGFLAHEVQDIVPEAITGEKDAVDDDGNPEYQGIDQSKLVPLLTAALQEAIGEIESLKARVAALETP